MATRTSIDTRPYSDKERLLRSETDSPTSDGFDNPTPPARSNPLTTIALLATLTLTLLLSILTTTHITHKSTHPFSIPSAPPPEICDHATARPAFHTLPLHRRHAYVRAVQRLTTLPSRLGLNTSLYDDFTYVHIQLTWKVHHVAISLPFHRYFVAVFEKVLKDEGGYDGVMPYWDWTVDAADPLSSAVFNSSSGFGRDGRAKDGCVDGLLGGKVANYSEAGYDPHCVTRVFDDDGDDGMLHNKAWSGDVVRDIMESSQTYDEFRERLENGPHRHLHWGIGGEMPSASSTNDPLFFLHHAQIDRLWWLWQQRNPEKRNAEFFGPIWVENEMLAESGAGILDGIKMLGLTQDVSVQQVMRTDTELLCYKYKMEL
ncbi:hypothetical protein OHC33_009369 [Knufia fluminis]|uniref:Tyrosinase copper-binding domain-containing protein n=1 Tax=Knufia fluminis TaxID=191047 RepID=A0AAN8I1Q1_9EURO|nr:hypothetical protein OHC33_009369 [Knufia fluminis]